MHIGAPPRIPLDIVTAKMARHVQPIRIPELEQFVVANVQLTGVEIGRGAYGSVEEARIPGALCAAKRLHEELLTFGSAQQVRELTTTFVRECTLMSQLRHPHITQFLGVCFLPGSRLPLLIMERLFTNLDSTLENTPSIPLDIKRSILLDVARGLTFLHSRTPPIIHRDLTARNVLLNESMVAKIADLGVARLVNVRPGQLAATMTRAPGNILYMPPEAVEHQSRYSTAIDIFSFGNLALFVLTQVFPELKAATYVDSRSRRVVGRTEVERRSEYFDQLHREFGEQHPLVQLVEQCLQNIPEDRPTIVQIMEQIEQLVLFPSRRWDMTKMEFVQSVVEAENEILKATNDQEEKKNVIEQLEQQIATLQAEYQHQRSQHDRQLSSQAFPKSVVFEWKKCKNSRFDFNFKSCLSFLEEKVYAIELYNSLVMYNPAQDEWCLQSELPDTIYYGTLTVVGDQLFFVGGRKKQTHEVSNEIQTWDSNSQKWRKLYPPMSQGRYFAAATGYKHYLIVISGMGSKGLGSYRYLTGVEILDTTNSQWYNAQPLPEMDHSFSTAIVMNDEIYIIEDDQAVFKASLPALVKSSHQQSSVADTLWERLPDIPLKKSGVAIINGILVTLGGYDKSHSKDTSIYCLSPLLTQWIKVGELPEKFDCKGAMLPSGELLIVGGNRVYVGTVSVQLQ